MVYPTIWIFIASLVAFCSKQRELSIHVGRFRLIFSAVCISSLLLAFYEGIVKIADTSVRKEKAHIAESLLYMPSNMKIPDERVYFMNAAIEKMKFDASHNVSSLHEADEYLSQAQKLNEIDPRIRWNRAFVLTKAKRYDAAEELWQQVLVKEKYNPEVYRMYAAFLKEKYAGELDKQKMKLDELNVMYEQNKRTLNAKAYLLLNQLETAPE